MANSMPPSTMSVLNQTSYRDSCFCLFNDASGPSINPSSITDDRPSERHQQGIIETEVWQRKKEMDVLLCQAMDNLSLEERKKQENILHGIDDNIEDEALLDRSLQDLDVH